MATEVYLGYPPPNVRAWIEEHAESRPRNLTYVTYIENNDIPVKITTQSFNIVGNVTSPYFDDELVDTCDGASIISIDFGNTVTSIDSWAFGEYNMINLTGVVIPDSVSSIGENAFEGCESLSFVSIGNGVSSIGTDAFKNTK